MATKIEDILNEFASNNDKFIDLVNNPAEFISNLDLEEKDASLLKGIAERSKTLVLFTPKNLTELASEVSKIPFPGSSRFDPAAAFKDAFTDKYSDKYSDSYSNSDGRISIDSWTKDLVLRGKLDITRIPGGGFTNIRNE